MFGSIVNSSNNVDSDIDIALVFSKTNDMIDIQVELMKLRRNVDLRIKPHPFLEEDFNIGNPFANEIIRFGIEI